MRPCGFSNTRKSNVHFSCGAPAQGSARRCSSIHAVPELASAAPPPCPTSRSEPMFASASGQVQTQNRPVRDLVSRVEDLPASSLVIGLVCVQILTLVGSLVGGHLARKRRIQVEALNSKLREVVGEMRKQQEESQANLVCSVDPDEALVAYQQALENSLAAPAAPHPVEGYGPEGNSLAAARRKISNLLTDARADLAKRQAWEAELKCTDALVRCKELGDKRAIRATLKLMAKAQKELHNYEEAYKTLDKAIQVSREIGDEAGDVDTLGMMADLQVTLGNLEKASKLYDEVIIAVRNEADAEPLTSWDC